MNIVYCRMLIDISIQLTVCFVVSHGKNLRCIKHNQLSYNVLKLICKLILLQNKSTLIENVCFCIECVRV